MFSSHRAVASAPVIGHSSIAGGVGTRGSPRFDYWPQPTDRELWSRTSSFGYGCPEAGAGRGLNAARDARRRLRQAQDLSACPAGGSWPVTRRDPALGTKTDSEPESQRTVISGSSTAVTTPLRVTLPTFSDSTSTRSPISTIVDLRWMVTETRPPQVSPRPSAPFNPPGGGNPVLGTQPAAMSPGRQHAGPRPAPTRLSRLGPTRHATPTGRRALPKTPARRS